jgi:hypothetical protein
MKQILAPLLVSVLFSMAPALASAACYAEYKAKRNNPLKLVYDVARISGPCTVSSASAQLKSKLAKRGLTLLKVMSVEEK